MIESNVNQTNLFVHNCHELLLNDSICNKKHAESLQNYTLPDSFNIILIRDMDNDFSPEINRTSNIAKSMK